MMFYAALDSPWGKLIAGIDTKGALFGLWFEGQKYFPNIPKEAQWLNPAMLVSENNVLVETVHRLNTQLTAYTDGRLKTFDLPLAPTGTPFQLLVWKELLKIPYGSTTSYGQVSAAVAAELGKASMSAQAVGGAIGHNPISIIIPCHRVVGAKGQLTGYAGGLDKKSALLNHELTHL